MSLTELIFLARGIVTLPTELLRPPNTTTTTIIIIIIIIITGTISKSFRKYVSNIPGKHKVQELQKIAILSTAQYFGKY